MYEILIYDELLSNLVFAQLNNHRCPVRPIEEPKNLDGDKISGAHAQLVDPFATHFIAAPTQDVGKSTRLVKLSISSVGAISQGSKTAVAARFNQAAFMPTDTAPITSNGLLDTNQLFSALLPVLSRKYR